MITSARLFAKLKNGKYDPTHSEPENVTVYFIKNERTKFSVENCLGKDGKLSFFRLNKNGGDENVVYADRDMAN